MLYEIEQAVFERFPGYARMAVVAEGVDNTREIPELAELLALCEEGVRRDDLEDFWHVPVLETWAEAFSGMGIKPKKNPPSVINLVKRCRSGKPLPFINPLVAIFNCISLKYLLPCGGDDRNVIKGDLRLGIADGTENYVPLGQPDVLEHPQPGEARPRGRAAALYRLSHAVSGAGFHRPEWRGLIPLCPGHLSIRRLNRWPGRAGPAHLLDAVRSGAFTSACLSVMIASPEP